MWVARASRTAEQVKPSGLIDIRCGDTSIALTGQTVNGTAIIGSDSLVTVDCR